MVQQVIAPGHAPEHTAHPAGRRFFTRNSRGRGSGGHRFVSHLSAIQWLENQRSSTPVTIFTSPIFTGNTKCTLALDGLLIAAQPREPIWGGIPSIFGIGPYCGSRL